MSSYEKIKGIKNQYRLDHFAIACSYFFDIGYRHALEITDEENENAQENGLMTKDFVQNRFQRGYQTEKRKPH